MSAQTDDRLQTEYAFVLPRGLVDDSGRVHRNGVMRLATAKDEIMPLDVEYVQLDENGKRKQLAFKFDTDEGPRKDTSLEALAKLRPVFQVGGTVTAFHFGMVTRNDSAWTLNANSTFTGSFCSRTAPIYCIGD